MTGNVSHLTETVAGPLWSVEYEVRSLIGAGADAVLSLGAVETHARDEHAAGERAVLWVRENDPLCDDRVDPVVTVRNVEMLEDSEDKDELLT